MFNSLRQRSKDEGGFTLIELLVVILIIGILAAIAIPSFLNQKGKAQDSSAKTQAASLQTAMETYATDNSGSYEGGTLGVEDGDTLLIQVDQLGAACHEGYKSCFFRSIAPGGDAVKTTEPQLVPPGRIYGKS